MTHCDVQWAGVAFADQRDGIHRIQDKYVDNEPFGMRERNRSQAPFLGDLMEHVGQ